MREGRSLSDEIEGKTCSFDLCCQCKDGCCQYAKPPLTLERQKIIGDYLKKQCVRIEKPFTHEKYTFPTVDEFGFCAFYTKERRKCLVHPVKPETCRAGPITFDINSRTRKVEWHLKMFEDCALAKKLYGDSDLFRKHFEVARAELLRLICELDMVALQAVLRIEEPRTFKIGEQDLPIEVIEKLKLCSV
jgi:Fe-S-cluster containining protein